MFVHTVLFEIHPTEVCAYRKDSKMWAAQAKKAKGFRGYTTMQRLGHKNQFASVYRWENKLCHDRFMHKYHEYLLGKSTAKVKVLDYFNLKAKDIVR